MWDYQKVYYNNVGGNVVSFTMAFTENQGDRGVVEAIEFDISSASYGKDGGIKFGVFDDFQRLIIVKDPFNLSQGLGIHFVELQAPVGLPPRLFIKYKNQPSWYTLRFTIFRFFDLMI